MKASATCPHCLAALDIIPQYGFIDGLDHEFFVGYEVGCDRCGYNDVRTH